MQAIPLASPTLAEREESANAMLPGWNAWATRSFDGSVSWSARPGGAEVAVIIGRSDAETLIACVREYEADLPRHLEAARVRLSALTSLTTGSAAAAEINVATRLVSALEKLSAARAAA